MLRVIKSDDVWFSEIFSCQYDSDSLNELKFNALVLILLNHYLNTGAVFIIYFKMIVTISKIVLREHLVFVPMLASYGSVESNSQFLWFCHYNHSRLAKKKLMPLCNLISTKIKPIMIGSSFSLLHISCMSLSGDFSFDGFYPLWLARVFICTVVNWQLLCYHGKITS